MAFEVTCIRPRVEVLNRSKLDDEMEMAVRVCIAPKQRLLPLLNVRHWSFELTVIRSLHEEGSEGHHTSPECHGG